MEFDHPARHTLDNLGQLERELAQGPISLHRAIPIAGQLTSHAHPSARNVIALLRDNARHSDILAHAAKLARCDETVRRYFQLEAFPRAQLERFYQPEGFIFLRKGSGSRKLLVIFTTMFNNFHFSNAVMAAMLGRLDCNLLFLKDGTLFNYHRGVAGFADSLPAIGPAIGRLAHSTGSDRIYMTGFSSCGYAALYTALTSPCHGYLGFSQPTDMRAGSPLEPPLYFTPDVRAAVDPAHLVDLKPLLEADDPAMLRTFVYAERNEHDASHVLHVADVPHVQAIALPGASHSTVEELGATDAIVPMFARLIAG